MFLALYFAYLQFSFSSLQQDGALKEAGSQVFPHLLKLGHTHTHAEIIPSVFI